MCVLEGVISGIVLRRQLAAICQAELQNISLMQPTLTCCPRPTMAKTAMNASVRVCECLCVSVCISLSVCVSSTRSVFKHGTLPLAAHLPHTCPSVAKVSSASQMATLLLVMLLLLLFSPSAISSSSGIRSGAIVVIIIISIVASEHINI